MKPTLVALLFLLAPTPARAETIVVCNVGGIGNTQQAAGGLIKFMRHMEKAAGLKAGTFQGEYHSTLRGCEAYLKDKKPAYAVFDLATFLARREALSLVPIAHMGEEASVRYHLVVKKGGPGGPAQLKGKTLITTLQDPRFAAKVVLAGKLDLAKDLKKLKVTTRPSKVLRNVARGKNDAGLVDALSFKLRKELKLKAELVSVFKSAGLPGLTMATLGGRAHKAQVARIIKALPKLCSGEGKDLCKTFSITNFKPAKAAVYTRLGKLY